MQPEYSYHILSCECTNPQGKRRTACILAAIDKEYVYSFADHDFDEHRMQIEWVLPHGWFLADDSKISLAGTFIPSRTRTPQVTLD